MGRKALIIGGGIESVQAALDLADARVEVTMAVEEASLQTGKSRSNITLMPKLLRAMNHPNINLITHACVTQVKGGKGNFKSTIVQQPRYVDINRCTSCSRCVEACPVVNIPGVKSRKAIHQFGGGLKSVPSTCHIHKEGMAPCSATCPAGVNPHGYIALISQGKITEALDLITQAVAFPRVLGRVCSHPCEKVCTRAKVDKAVSICALKRYAAAASSSEASLMRSQHTNAKNLTGPARVAIIGAGPAGLTAARDLARFGHRSTVFEALPSPGGMITVGMPRFRLPREVRQADINDIVKLGIEIKTSTPIGKDLTLEDLKKKGYEAILIATGAHKNQRIGIAGENLSGVIDSIALLQALNLKQPISVGKRVIVVGGGYTAIDSARTAVRLNCDKVTLLYRRSLDEMPANAEEVAEAQEERVEIQYLVAPVRIIGENGKVAGVECQRMALGEPDASGRRRPIPIEGSEFCIEADTVIVAVGQRPDLSFLGESTELTGGGRHIVVDRRTMATKVPGIFAAGDVIGEIGTLIEAIAAGRKAAVFIDKFLRGEELKEERPPKPVLSEVDLTRLAVPEVPRQQIPLLPLKARVHNFEEVDLGFSAEAAIKEAQRCLNCGGCSECLECVSACELDAIDHDEVVQQFDIETEAVIVAGKYAQKLPVENIYTLPHSDLSEASAIASRVMVELSKQRSPKEVRRARAAQSVDNQSLPSMNPRIGVFVCKCGGNISDTVDISDLLARFQWHPGMVCGGDIEYACTENSAGEIEAIARENNLSHVVLASCSCCNLDHICFSCSDRRIACKTNLLNNRKSSIKYEFVNIREHVAWVHRNEPEVATAKAASLIKAAIARATESHAAAKTTINIERSALVIGGGLSGMQAAADLSAQEFHTILLSNKPSLSEKLESELNKNGAIVLRGAKLASIEGTTGNYRINIVDNGASHIYNIGAIILDVSDVKKKELPTLLQKALKGRNGSNEPAMSLVPGVFLCGHSKDADQALTEGSAAAAKAAVMLNKGDIEITEAVAIVDRQRCRGCGMCVSICPSGAARLIQANGIATSWIDEGLCLGCGICISHCPSGALTQNGCSDSQLTASLEAILS